MRLRPRIASSSSSLMGQVLREESGSSSSFLARVRSRIMSLAMMLSALVRCRVSATNGRRISSVPGISHLPIEIAEADVPQPDVVEHMGFHVAADARRDGPVHQLAVAGLQELVGRELSELAALA